MGWLEKVRCCDQLRELDFRARCLRFGTRADRSGEARLQYLDRRESSATDSRTKEIILRLYKYLAGLFAISKASPFRPNYKTRR